MGSGEARETRTPAVTLPASIAGGQCFFKKKTVIYTLFIVIFCNIDIVSFFLIQYFETLPLISDIPIFTLYLYIIYSTIVCAYIYIYSGMRKFGNPL